MCHKTSLIFVVLGYCFLIYWRRFSNITFPFLQVGMDTRGVYSLELRYVGSLI
jgi:hypothetical protein